MSNGLIAIDAGMDAATAIAVAKRWAKALSECRSVDEVKLMRDKAQSVAHFLKVRGANEEAQRASTIMKIDAERRLGELIPRRPVGNPNGSILHDEKLNGMDFHPVEAHRWHIMAELPDEHYSDYRNRSLSGECEPSSSAVYKLGKQWVAQNTPPDTEQLPHPDFDGRIVGNLQELVDAGAKFGTIYADPPWKYGNQATRASTDNHYGTMTIDQICSEPVNAIAAEQSHLHLWTTNAFLFEAKRVIEAWGFEYKSCFVWVKPQMGIGNYWRVSHEFLLLGVKGGLRFSDKGQKSWMSIDRQEHSEKPREITNLIEKVSPGPYLEMYGREPMSSPWTVYGNQIDWNLFHGRTA